MGRGFVVDVASGSKEARSWRCYRRGRGKSSKKNEPTGGLHLSEEKKRREDTGSGYISWAALMGRTGLAGLGCSV
jgi:hypothetical protein